MHCIRCDLAAPFGAASCVACGSVAFYHGQRPGWPPVLPEHNPSFLALLLGDIPRPPRLALLDDRDERRELARPARNNGHEKSA